MENKIGIGITTMDTRMELFNYTLQKICDLAPPETVIYTHVDRADKRKGIAASKNACLRVLQDCDHIFLFDDDCYPVHPDWYKVFIEASERTGEQHLMYLYNCNTTEQEDPYEKNGLLVYRYYYGVMLYFTKKCLETAGGYNEEFQVYGYEHAEISNRIFNMGLTTERFQTIPDIKKYIYSIDCDGRPADCPEYPNSMTGMDKEAIISANYPVFLKNLHSKTKIEI